MKQAFSPSTKFVIDGVLKKASFDVEADIFKNAHLILKDMHAGLAKNNSSSLAMLHSKLSISSIDYKKVVDSDKIIAIDLGGSNLRSSIVFLDGNDVIVDELKELKCKKEYENCADFFTFIATSVEYLKNKSCKIVFCFSYALKFLKMGEALVTALSKELSVPEIEGKNVGSELLKVLKKQGWQDETSVFVTNDTIATLFAGLYKNIQDGSCTRQNTKEQKKELGNSFMSIVLGTGLNAAYFERNEDDVVILEAGAFDKIARSHFDEKVINETKATVHHILEKQCSAHYLGPIAFEVFKTLTEHNAFSQEFRLLLDSRRGDFGSWMFLNEIIVSECNKKDAIFQKLGVFIKEYDFDVICYVVEQLIFRTANLISSLVVAIAMKMKNERTVKIFAVTEGSTILKTHTMLSLVKQKVNECLKEIGGIEVEFVRYEHATLIGSAILKLLF